MKESDYINATNARTLAIAGDVLRHLLFKDEKVQMEVDAMRARLAILRDETYDKISTRAGQ